MALSTASGNSQCWTFGRFESLNTSWQNLAYLQSWAELPASFRLSLLLDIKK